MSDYTKTTNFTAKDSLASGDPNKLIKGALFDTEFDNLVTAVATKFDSNDLASEATAEALTSNTTLLTPLRLDNVFKDNAGMLSDIQALADPAADTLLGWDDSAGAAIGFTLHASILHSGTELSVDHDAATNFVANEHIDHTSVSITAGDGLTGGGTIAATRSLGLDISGLTAIDIASLAATDGIYVDDAGVAKRMAFQDIGLRFVASDANQTFALGDANTAQAVAATARTYTIPANSAVAFNVGTVIGLVSTGAGTITIDPDTGVTINSVIAQGSTANRTVVAGGMALLYKVGADAWNLTGDIS